MSLFGSKPASKPAPHTLTATVAAHRNAALEKHNAERAKERDATLARLQSETAAARAEHTRSTEEAARIVEAREREIDASIAKELQEVLTPIAAKFGDAPRSMAGQLAPIWRDFATRVREEVGGEIHCCHLVFALAGDDPRVADERFWMDATHGAANHASQAIMNGAAIPVVEELLRSLEVAIAKQVAGIGFFTEDRLRAVELRFAAMRSQASQRGVIAAFREHDARVAAEQAAVGAKENAKAFAEHQERGGARTRRAND